MKDIKVRIKQELKKGILQYWIETAMDEDHGGFHGLITNNNEVVEGSEKGLIQNARNLWSFSRAYNHFGDVEYLEMAIKAKKYVQTYLWDNDFGGFFWTVDVDGNPLNTRKQIYGQAFAIYALCEFYAGTKDEEALNLAVKTYDLLEQYGHDKKNNGYFEAFSRDWSIIDDVRLSPVDLNEKKSNNTHLHILEAYTSLVKLTDNDSARERLKNVVELMVSKVMDRKTLNFMLFFDEQWNKKCDVISYGHEIEASWLIYEAALAIGDKDYISNIKETVINIADKCYANYLDGDSGRMGMFNEDDGSGNIDKDKIWWVQAEACVGFHLAYELTGKEYFLDAVKNIWEFIEEHIVDKENGEWFWYGTDDATKSKRDDKISNWKSLYHNGRACIELLERIK